MVAPPARHGVVRRFVLFQELQWIPDHGERFRCIRPEDVSHALRDGLAGSISSS
jgi:hypothetical protein